MMIYNFILYSLNIKNSWKKIDFKYKRVLYLKSSQFSKPIREIFEPIAIRHDSFVVLFEFLSRKAIL